VNGGHSRDYSSIPIDLSLFTEVYLYIHRYALVALVVGAVRVHPIITKVFAKHRNMLLLYARFAPSTDHMH
jgi:hypothetical protein